MKFKESEIANEFLDGLKGVEIGGSAHNSFGLNTINVDYTDEITVYKQAEIEMCGEYLPVDVVADAQHLPFKDETWDFVISSHNLEHLYKPISVLREWKRVIKQGGYIYIIVPKPEVCPDDTVYELEDFIKRELEEDVIGDSGHISMMSFETLKELFNYLQIDVMYSNPTDDKVGNGLCVIGQKVHGKLKSI